MSLIETKNLTAFYGDFQALFGVNIVLNPGETIAVIGANGAGKSTLMRSIAGVLRNEPTAILHRGQATAERELAGAPCTHGDDDLRHQRQR